MIRRLAHRPPYTVEELENTPYTGRDVTPAQPRFVYVLWNNEMHDGSEIFAVYASEKAANEAAQSPFHDVKRVPFYEH